MLPLFNRAKRRDFAEKVAISADGTVSARRILGKRRKYLCIFHKLQFGGVSPLTVRAGCICIRYCPDPLGIVTAGQLDKLDFGGVSPLTVRAGCICIRYCPDPLGIVTAGQLDKLDFGGVSPLTVRAGCICIRYCPVRLRCPANVLGANASSLADRGTRLCPASSAPGSAGQRGPLGIVAAEQLDKMEFCMNREDSEILKSKSNPGG